MSKDSRVNFRASPEARLLFQEVARRIGVNANVSKAIHVLMYDRARELGIAIPGDTQSGRTKTRPKKKTTKKTTKRE